MNKSTKKCDMSWLKTSALLGNEKQQQQKMNSYVYEDNISIGYKFEMINFVAIF